MKNPWSYILPVVTAVCVVFTLSIHGIRNEARTPLTQESVPVLKYDQADLLDINTADEAQLMALPGIGRTLAQRIIAYREMNGPFTSVAQLLLVEGLGQGKLENILDMITVGGSL